MQPRITRTLVAAAGSASLIVGGAMSAGASGHDDHHGKQQYGWIKVCQNVKKYDDGKGEDEYLGQYQVKDAYGSVWRFKLNGKYDCRQVRVHKGNVSVKVLYQPDYTDLYGDANRYVYVKKDGYARTTFQYKAVDYGWVKVCQDVKDYDHAKGKDDHNEYRGTYEVEDSYGDVTDLYLSGKYDCDQVKVHTGKVDVKVTYRPEHTYLKGDDDVYVDVRKGDYEDVTFEYVADHYSSAHVA
jgi:hypothetical protein